MSNVHDFFTALSSLKMSRATKPALWSVVVTMLLLAAAQPSAYGLEFPMTTRLVLPDSANLTTSISLDPSEAPVKSANLPIAEMAIVANLSQQVELARTMIGAKKVAKSIAISEYNWDESQYKCLNRLWTKESHWNYKAHNYRSGAHGIAQALPATKMEVISTDWRTNPVTQIRWGMRYISIRYSEPCTAWAKWKRSRYY